ncbi:MAG: phage/plasmid replication protein, II/X family [Brachymonas sp.]
MAYDTLRLRSPFLLSPGLFERIKQKCILRSGTDLESGELLYELHTGELMGSWDARISVQPKTEEWVTDKAGRPRLVDSPPYIVVEASIHKVLYGQNIFGGSNDIRHCCASFVDVLQKLLGVPLPHFENWQVLKVDVSHVYALPLPAIKQFFDGLQLLSFPRRTRKASRYEMAAHFPGRTTTIKLYHKGTEFKVHDYPRLRSFFKTFYDVHNGTHPENIKKAARKVDALHRLAQNRLRVEVSIHSDKFFYDLGKHPRVNDLNDDYLHNVHASEVERLLREGKQAMQTVRTTQQVMARLNNEYGQQKGMRLYGFWSSMVTLGDESTKRQYSRSTFFQNRKDLEQAGVSWRGSDVHVVANDTLLPVDFVPLPTDSRLCYLPARSRAEFASNSRFLTMAA